MNPKLKQDIKNSIYSATNPIQNEVDVLSSTISAAALPQKAKITLTANQLRSLHTTPIDIIPAPGANKYIRLANAVFYYKHGTASFTAGRILYTYNGSWNESVGELSAAVSLVDLTEDFIQTDAMKADTYTPSNIIDKKLTLKADQTFLGATSTSTLTIVVEYTIVDLS